MLPFKLKTKYFTLEIFRRGIVFTVASLLFASGVNLVNGNIFLVLISVVNKHVFDKCLNDYGFWVGIVLILISLFLFYLIIINWRIEIYSKIFIQLRKLVDKYGTLINYRLSYFSSEKLNELRSDLYLEYQNTLKFINENQTNLDIETFQEAIELCHKIGKSFEEFVIYNEELSKFEKNIDSPYSLDLANKELRKDLKDFYISFNQFVEIIKQKEKFKIISVQ